MPKPKIKLNCSRYLEIALIVLHFSVILFFLLLKINWIISTIVAVLMLINLLHLTNKHVLLKLPESIKEVWLDESGFWHLHYQNDSVECGRIRGDTYLSNWLLVLNFDLLKNGRTKSLVILRDMISADEWRHLLVFLRAEGLKRQVRDML